LNLREARIVTRFDYRNLVRSGPGVVFLVIYLLIAVLLGTALADVLRHHAGAHGPAKGLGAGTMAVFAWFVGNKPDVIRFLALDRPPVMSFYFLACLLGMPIMTLFLSFNQVSGYVSRRTIRYIIPKTGRLELYLGLFASNLTFFTVVSGALAAIMTVGWALVAKDVSAGTVILYSLRIFLSVWLSSVPLIAFMSMIAALTGSPVATVFLGLGAYLVIDLAGWYLTKQTKWGVILYYVLPLEPKYWFAYPGMARFLWAAALMPLYAAGYLAVGWIFLKGRDL